MPTGVGGPGLLTPPVKPDEESIWRFRNGRWQAAVNLPSTPTTFYDNALTIADETDTSKAFKIQAGTQNTGIVTTLDVGAQTASYSLSVPVLVGNDTIVTAGTAQTIGGAKTFSAAVSMGSTLAVTGAATLSSTLDVTGNANIKIPYNWPAAQAVGALTNDGAGVLTWSPSAGTIAAYWAKISSSTSIAVTAAVTATANRVHEVSGITADYTITLPAAPATGTVVGFVVGRYGVASKQYILDAGAGVIVCGRTRYLNLVHGNVALLYFDGTIWTPLVLCLDTQWIEASAITITASTTNPTKGTIVTDKLYWRRVGDMCKVRCRYLQGAAGTAGAGTYRVGIPFAYNTALVGTRVAEGTRWQAAQSQAGLGKATIDVMVGTASHGTIYANTAAATHLSVSTVNETGATAYVWGADFHLGTADVGFSADFTYPALDW